MNAADLAALIAAVFWALLVCAGVFVLLRLGRLLSESTRLMAELRERGDALLQRAQAAVDGAQAAVDRASRQLDRTESLLARGGDPPEPPAHGGAPSPPVPPWADRTAAFAYGVRHAVGLRRAARRTLPGRVVERGELARGGKAAR